MPSARSAQALPTSGGSRAQPTPVAVFTDPVVQLAALCPLCALAAVKPEAALAALSPTLAIFNPALNPNAALLSFSLSLTAELSRRGGRLVQKGAQTVQRASLAQLQLSARLTRKLIT